MELFTQLFGDLLAFVYPCFDRIVIYGYLGGLSRPEQVAPFFRNVVGVPAVDKEVLSQRTADYQAWVEAFARNRRLPIEWAERGVRKEDYVLPWQRRMTKREAYGVYFIFKSMEQGATFRVTTPKYATKDPNYRILAPQRSRFTHYYFYIRDEVLGPMVMRVASFFPFQTSYYLNGHSFIEQELKRAQIGFRKTDNAFLAVADVAALQAAADKLGADIIRRRLDYWTLILGPKFSAKERKQFQLSRFYAITQIEYCRNFIFKRHFPIHKLFDRSCELGLWRLTADNIAEIFGTRVHRRINGKLATIIDRIEHGHHVFRAYFKHAFLKQDEKFSFCAMSWSPTISPISVSRRDWTISRPCASASRPSPLASPATRHSGSTSMSISRCSSAWLCRSPLVRFVIPASRSTTPVSSASLRFSCTAAVTSAGGRQSTSTTPSPPASTYPRVPTASTSSAMTCASSRATASCSATARATPTGSHRKGVHVALLFLFFHKRLCGPLANSCFHHRPDPHHHPVSKLEAAYHRADKAIQQIVDLLAA